MTFLSLGPAVLSHYPYVRYSLAKPLRSLCVACQRGFNVRDQSELHHTVNSGHGYPSCCRISLRACCYVGLATLNMVQLWAELDIAGVGLAFAHLRGVSLATCDKRL